MVRQSTFMCSGLRGGEKAPRKSWMGWWITLYNNQTVGPCQELAHGIYFKQCWRKVGRKQPSYSNKLHILWSRGGVKKEIYVLFLSTTSLCCWASSHPKPQERLLSLSEDTQVSSTGSRPWIFQKSQEEEEKEEELEGAVRPGPRSFKPVGSHTDALEFPRLADVGKMNRGNTSWKGVASH